MDGIRNFVIKEKDVPIIQSNEVLVKLKSVGICGSDVHYYKEGRIANFIVKGPLILGHEAAGEIVEVGKNVENLKVGDRVALEPGIPDRTCFYCKTGRYNLCPNIKFWATPPIDGVFTEYVAHPADFCFKIPSSVSYEEGSMFEPLSVGLWAVEKAGLRPEFKVGVLGSGTIGIMTLQSILSFGVIHVTAFDVFQPKLDIAKKLGAENTVSTKDSDSFRKYYDSFDVVFETAGNPLTTLETVNLVKPGGTIVLVGLTSTDRNSLNTNLLITKEVTLKGSFRYANMYPRAVELVSAGKIKLKELISRHFTLEQLKEAFEFTINNSDKVIKTMVNIE